MERREERSRSRTPLCIDIAVRARAHPCALLLARPKCSVHLRANAPDAPCSIRYTTVYG